VCESRGGSVRSHTRRMDAVSHFAASSPIMSAAAALLAAASGLGSSGGCCEALPPPAEPAVPLALATLGPGAAMALPVPVVLMSGFNGADVLAVLNQLLCGSHQRVRPRLLPHRLPRRAARAFPSVCASRCRGGHSALC
jgi:hypothetical protein